MKNTLLVSAAEKHEHQVHLCTVVVEFPDSLVTDDGLSNAQMHALLEQLAPILKGSRLEDFERMELRYLVDGVPALEQVWTRAENSHEPGRRVHLGLGECLWLVCSERPSAAVLSLS